jgi:hypothetical protein
VGAHLDARRGGAGFVDHDPGDAAADREDDAHAIDVVLNDDVERIFERSDPLAMDREPVRRGDEPPDAERAVVARLRRAPGLLASGISSGARVVR